MINKVILVGRLTKEVELRKTNSNTSVCSFTLACNRRFQSAQGGQTADFINCIAWRQSAEFLARYASKGSIVGVEGRISTRSYDNQQGQKVYVTEVTCDSVQLIGSNRNSAEPSNYSANVPNNQTFTPSSGSGYGSEEDDFSSTPSLDISSDDLPFY
ncbi:MAG: single-stranded DNA-binding protein [Erysipelotrichaceae bacterium]|nr:single-stranded DNA-binding protein [Erysipelotrichaceae bacterium]